MNSDFEDNQENLKEEKTVLSSPEYMDPFYETSGKKKKKKKKPFPTDPDDPESDDDFDDDDDDDDPETSGETDDGEDENELKQEEKKQETTFKDPFLTQKQTQNEALKQQPNNPEKRQRSLLQKFFDVLLYGVEGAKLRNGDLQAKNSIFDELLLGLGFKAYLKDVLLNNQLIKHLKQKANNQENPSFIKQIFKNLKKKMFKDSELKSVLSQMKKQLDKAEKKTTLISTIQEKSTVINQQKKEESILNRLKMPQRPAPVGKKAPEKTKVVLTKEEAKKILQAVEEEEKRFKTQERRLQINQEKENAAIQLKLQRDIKEQKQVKSYIEHEKSVATQKDVAMAERSQIMAGKEVAQTQKATLLSMQATTQNNQSEKDYAMQTQMQKNQAQSTEKETQINMENLAQTMAQVATATLAGKALKPKAPRLPQTIDMLLSQEQAQKSTVEKNTMAETVRLDENGRTQSISAPKNEMSQSALASAGQMYHENPTIQPEQNKNGK